MKKKLETIITEVFNKDIETFYKDIESMQKLKERFEKILYFICETEPDQSDELIEETEKIIFELDKKIREYYNESNIDKFQFN